MQKVGILGGGQLGRMLLQAAANYPVVTYLMDREDDCPAAHLTHHFIQGDISDFQDVYNFGKHLDAITIEIEAVNEEALARLESEGVRVYPKSAALTTIKNKILQKKYYRAFEIPTADFIVTNQRSELADHISLLPAVHKISKGGFDGRGVINMHREGDFINGFNEPAVLEKKIDIRKEISIIIAISDSGQLAVYPPVEMIFDPQLNMLSHQISPAQIEEKMLWKIEALALKVVKNLSSAGIFAVEMFIDHRSDVWVNETAPRVHNSGHHTIEANYSSQFDMLWRIILGYPLGNTRPITPAALVNLVGSQGQEGSAEYHGLENILSLENVFVHIYGKKNTKPGRKMGHVTILSQERQELIHTALKIRSQLKVMAE